MMLETIVFIDDKDWFIEIIPIVSSFDNFLASNGIGGYLTQMPYYEKRVVEPDKIVSITGRLVIHTPNILGRVFAKAEAQEFIEVIIDQRTVLLSSKHIVQKHKG